MGGVSVTKQGEEVISSRPSRDPDVPHPGMVFAFGHWCSPEAVRRRRERDNASEGRRLRNARSNARTVRVGPYYVGQAPTAEIANTLNHETREHFAQKEEA